MPDSQLLPRYLIRNKNDNFLQCLSSKSPLIIGVRNKKRYKISDRNIHPWITYNSVNSPFIEK